MYTLRVVSNPLCSLIGVTLFCVHLKPIFALQTNLSTYIISFE